MKSRRIGWILALAVVIGFSPIGRSDVSVNIRVGVGFSFHEWLEPHGYWVHVEGYGRCWYPVGVAVEWRPYVYGHWIWTDGGWYWESDEPWAWACYHYGRWAWTPRYGWVWVPGYEWAPAWVYWREGGGYIGWAPLTPECVFGVDGHLIIRETWFAPTAFVFVEHRSFHKPIRPSVVVINEKIVHKTVNITKVTKNSRDSTTIININNGPQVATIEKASGKKVVAVKAQEARMRVEKSAVDTNEQQKKEKSPKQKPPPRAEPTTRMTAPPAGKPTDSDKKIKAKEEESAAPAKENEKTKQEKKSKRQPDDSEVAPPTNKQKDSEKKSRLADEESVAPAKEKEKPKENRKPKAEPADPETTHPAPPPKQKREEKEKPQKEEGVQAPPKPTPPDQPTSLPQDKGFKPKEGTETPPSAPTDDSKGKKKKKKGEETEAPGR